jgi:hypothetical protein
MSENTKQIELHATALKGFVGASEVIIRGLEEAIETFAQNPPKGSFGTIRFFQKETLNIREDLAHIKRILRDVHTECQEVEAQRNSEIGS